MPKLTAYYPWNSNSYQQLGWNLTLHAIHPKNKLKCWQCMSFFQPESKLSVNFVLSDPVSLKCPARCITKSIFSAAWGRLPWKQREKEFRTLRTNDTLHYVIAYIPRARRVSGPRIQWVVHVLYDWEISSWLWFLMILCFCMTAVVKFIESKLVILGPGLECKHTCYRVCWRVFSCHVNRAYDYVH